MKTILRSIVGITGLAIALICASPAQAGLSGYNPCDGPNHPTYDWMDGWRYWPRVLPHVWIGTSVENQKTADERIPHSRKVPAAVRYVMLTPREEIDLRPKAPDTYGQLGTCYRGVDPVALTASPDRVLNCFPRIGWAIVSGDTEPLHPDCVRSLRDQCQAAGVPFWFEGWGEWAPGNFGPGGDLYDRDRTKIESGMFDYSGHWNSGGPNPFRQTMDRVGKKAAGRTLDGREWNELPEVGK